MSSKFSAYADKFNALREKLQEQRENEEKKSSGGFDDSWKFKPTLPSNKPKVNYEVRVLPNVHTELGEPWVKAFFHMFRRPDGKFIYTLCPTTFGKDKKCPICEKARKLFNTNDQLDEKEARNIYRKARYFANVLVVKDPRSGEENQEGQVLVWEFGKQIFDKFTDSLIDQDIRFFHPLEGHNFNLTIKEKAGFPDYSLSMFSPKQTAISDDEDEMDRIFDEIHDLEDKVFGRGPKDYDKLTEMLTGHSSDDDDTEEKVRTGRTMDTDTDSSGEDDVVDEDVSSEVEETSDDDDDDDFDFDFDDD